MTPLQKLPKNVGDLGKLIVAKGFEKFPTVQYIAQSGYTGRKEVIFETKKLRRREILQACKEYLRWSNGQRTFCKVRPWVRFHLEKMQQIISVNWRRPLLETAFLQW